MATDPAEIWDQFDKYHSQVRDRLSRSINLDRRELGAVRRKENKAYLAVKQAQIDYGKGSAEHVAATKDYADVKREAKAEEDRIKSEITTKSRKNAVDLLQ